MRKEEFVRTFRDTIVEWSKLHERELLDYEAYRWKSKTYEGSVRTRNELEGAIESSRKKNDGGIDLGTADKIYRWGLGRLFPMRDEKVVLEATREAFRFLDEGDCYQACKRLMRIKRIGVAGATKVLGLSNQEKFCIFDSRVGYALSDLTKDGEKIIRRPPGRSIKGDYVAHKHEWALDYQKLIWTLEIVHNRLKEKAPNSRIADIEMALFMKGRGEPSPSIREDRFSGKIFRRL